MGCLKAGVRASSPVLVQARTPAHQYGAQAFPIIPTFQPARRLVHRFIRHSLGEGGSRIREGGTLTPNT